MSAKDHLKGLAEELGVVSKIIIALGASIGGHPHHRIGNRYQDIEEMGGDIDNPAGV